MGNKTKSNSGTVENENCRFCEIIKYNHDKVILYEDEIMVLFHDRRPKATVHLQAVPKKHIRNVNYLIKDDIKLLLHLRDKTNEYMIKVYGEKSEIHFGFHIPPFYSVSHLHMHCIIPPYQSRLEKLTKYWFCFRSFESQICKLNKKD